MTNPETGGGSSAALATVLGVGAIVLWSTVFAFSRSLAEQVGPITNGSYTYLAAGTLGCLWALVRSRGASPLRGLTWRYAAGCGGLFVVYTVAIYLAIGLAEGRRQTIVAGIINYLWPGLTLVLAVPILGKRARPWLIPGAIVAFAGVALTMAAGAGFTWDGLREAVAGNRFPYAMALVAAVSWALYSNLIGRWADESAPAAVPLFMLATGLVMTLLRLVRPEESHWSARAVAEFAYLTLGPTLLAYSFWEFAMRRGRATLVVSVSYLTPILSTIISSVYLGVGLGPGLWVGCALVFAGAWVCRRSIIEPKNVETRVVQGGQEP